MKNIFLYTCALFVIHAKLSSEPKKMIISVPVADLRSKPNLAPMGLQSPALSKDIGDQDSQCLFCESVIAEFVDKTQEWCKIYALNQKAWRDSKWTGYPGFIQSFRLVKVEKFPEYNIVLQNLWTPMFIETNEKSKVIMNLAIGTMLEAKKINYYWWEVLVNKKVIGYIKASRYVYEFSKEIIESEIQLRKKIVQNAFAFVNQNIPYVWGGRSPLNINFKNQITGIDCSGLTNLCYQACGLAIPRDAGPQRRSCYEIQQGKDLKPADLIFFANDEQGLKIGHVVIYLGNGQIIESTGRGFSSVHDLDNPELNKNNLKASDLGVRLIDIKNLVEVDICEIENGKTIAKNGKSVFLGSYFGPDGNLDKIKRMRLIALGQEF